MYTRYVFLNAADVTVFYFEWLKNLSPRFGRLNKRFEEASMDSLLYAVESVTGKEISVDDRDMIARGADEIDLVNSGLEETMITAYDSIREIYVTTKGIETLRRAAFVCAINKIAVSYLQLGIFP